MPADFTLPDGITGPMPTDVADHVAAVSLFGKPSNGFLNTIDTTAPPITIGSHYSAKTIDLYRSADPVCSPTGNDVGTHSLYATNGMVEEAAAFASQRVPPGS